MPVVAMILELARSLPPVADSTSVGSGSGGRLNVGRFWLRRPTSVGSGCDAFNVGRFWLGHTPNGFMQFMPVVAITV